MEEPAAINKVTAQMNISSRTLRYWESAGLFQSTRDINSGWRVYDENALIRIRITDLLRRLEIPIKDIKEIIETAPLGETKSAPRGGIETAPRGGIESGIRTGAAESVCRVLEKQLNRLSGMSEDIKTRKDAVLGLINLLRAEQSVITLSSLENILLPAAYERKKYDITQIKKGLNMENLKTKYSEVQIIKIPSMKTAAYSCVGTEPEDEAMAPVIKWIKENNLSGTMRLFGFNTEPYPTEENPAYGFGFCASVPEGTEIPKPLYEMRLPGGTYAVVSQYSGDPSFGWKKINELLNDREWEWEWDGERNPGLEEHIEKEGGGFFIPILFPVKKKGAV